MDRFRAAIERLLPWYSAEADAEKDRRVEERVADAKKISRRIRSEALLAQRRLVRR